MALPGLGLPGLGIEEPSEQQQTIDPTRRELPAESEWRFEVAFGKYVQVRVNDQASIKQYPQTDLPQLLSGEAELFGSELSDGPTYTFTGTKAAIFTHHGCTLETSHDLPQSEYTADETPMTEYVNLHFALETLRTEAASSTPPQLGPRILLLGPSNAGKTSLAKLLTAYAIRSDRQPIVVNLDPKEPLLSLPGTLTAVPFKTMLDIEDGWGSSPLSGPSAIPVKLPLVYNYGLPDPTLTESTAAQYKAVLSKLALAVAGRLAEDPLAATAGLIIDTPPALANTPSPLASSIIEHIITEFSVSHIVILGSERLYSDMLRTWDGKPTSTSTTSTSIPPSTSTTTLPNGIHHPTITVAKLSKSGGCVDRDSTFLSSARAAQIRAYFYGPPTPPPASSNTITAQPGLSPRQQQVDFSSLAIYKLRSNTGTASSGSAGGDIGPGAQGAENSLFAPGGGLDEEESGVGGGDYDPTTVQPPASASTSSSNVLTLLTTPTLSLVSHILVIVDAEPEAAEKEILGAPVLGFVYVADVVGGRVTLLTPVPGRVPRRAMVWSEEWPGLVQGLV